MTGTCVRQKNKIRDGLVWGGILVLAGTFFLLEHTGKLGEYSAWQFWPLALVIWGLAQLTDLRYRGAWLCSLAFIAGGGLLVVHNLALAVIPWQIIGSLAAIGIGCLLIWTLIFRKPAAFVPKSKRSVDGWVLFGGREDRYTTDDFCGGKISAIFGENILDLSRAQMIGEETHLSVRAVLGEVKLKLPENWQVVVKGFPILGVIDNKTSRGIQPQTRRPRLVIHAEVVLGSLDLSN